MQHLLFQRLAALSIFCVILSLGFGASPAFARNAIQVRLTSAPQTFDWNRATSGSESAVIRNLMEGLFTFDSAYNPVPQLAKSFQWSADRKTLDLILRKEVVWNDGTPLKAQQFADSFERLLNPTLNSPNAAILFDLVGARDYFFGKTKNFSSVGVSVIHDDHLRLVLAEPRSNFLNALTHWSTFPVRKDKMEAFPRVTLGPYQLAKETSPLTLTKNPHYLGPSAAITKIIFKIIPDGTTAIAEYQKGNLDYLLQVEDELLDQKISAMPGIGFVDPIRVVALLHFNPSGVQTNTPEKRRAIMAAIPTEALIAQSPKTRIAANSIIPRGMPGAPNPFTVIAKGDGHSASASLPEQTLTLAYPKDSLSQSIAEQIQSTTAQTGKLKIIAEALPSNDAQVLHTLAKRYDLVLTLFGLDYHDPDQLLSSFLAQGTHDLFNTSSADLLEILQRARNSTKEAERDRIYAAAAEYLQAKIAIVMPLFYRRRAYLLRPTFHLQKGASGTAKIQKIH